MAPDSAVNTVRVGGLIARRDTAIEMTGAGRRETNASAVNSAAVTTIHAVRSRRAALFRTRIYGGGVDLQLGRQYDVAPDGRFLINTELDDAAAPITLVMNWQPEGKK